MYKIQMGWLAIVIVFIFSSCSSLKTRQNKIGSLEVLEGMQQGKEFFLAGEYDKSITTFLRTSELINAIWANTEDSKQARSLWYSEKAKNFKGEPYERMMVFYYLGILFLMNEDFGNAQAAFKQMTIQKATTDKENPNESNIYLAYLLAGISLYNLGSSTAGDDFFNRYEQSGKTLPFNRDKIPNVLFFLETGNSPKKVLNEDKTAVLYVNQEENVPSIVFEIKEDINQEKSLADASKFIVSNAISESIYEHALDRGQRLADEKNKSKQNVKEVSGWLGKASLQIGSLLAGISESSDTLAAGFLISGLISKLISANVVYEADDRYWNNIPGSIHVGFFNLDAGSYSLNINGLPPASAKNFNNHQTINVDRNKKVNLFLYSKN